LDGNVGGPPIVRFRRTCQPTRLPRSSTNLPLSAGRLDRGGDRLSAARWGRPAKLNQRDVVLSCPARPGFFFSAPPPNWCGPPDERRNHAAECATVTVSRADCACAGSTGCSAATGRPPPFLFFHCTVSAMPRLLDSAEGPPLPGRRTILVKFLLCAGPEQVGS